ncbi:unnamed protein product [Dibothriocephalus latus]|uniref:Uncharacterized protein n=1 Tax=Dibothriocephalus latus TaxID=60516 RepID=A0A3P7L2X1_DIBLA|nr:unnamed protein product [Dibothriocephalus latus]
MFEETFEAGFKITSAKLDNDTFDDCSKQYIGKNTAKECYTQSESCEVHFIIDDKSKYNQVKFMVGAEAKVTYEIKEGVLVEKNETSVKQGAAAGTTIEKKNFPLSFIPTEMQLVSTTGDAVVKVNKPCPTKPAEKAENCLTISNEMFPVTVKANMAEAVRVLMFTGEGSKTLEVTFKPKGNSGSSAAAWISHSVALILANLAMVYVFP